MSSIPKIAILITCHNRKPKTLKCLRNLFLQEGIDKDFQLEIFVVDDGSTDGTSEAILEQFSRVNIIKGNGSLYWNRGMYLAWETAARKWPYDFYLWLNDDTYLLENAIETLLSGVAIFKKKCIYIGSTSSEYNLEITYGGHRKNTPLLKPNGTWQTCDFYNGNIVLISKEVYEIVGKNDRIFRHALGDFDYGLRAKNNNIELFLAPQLLGFCESHEYTPDWCNSNVNIFKRAIDLYKPLGNNPFEYFIFDLRHNGFLKAIKHMITIHLRAISPNFWSRLK